MKVEAGKPVVELDEEAVVIFRALLTWKDHLRIQAQASEDDSNPSSWAEMRRASEAEETLEQVFRLDLEPEIRREAFIGTSPLAELQLPADELAKALAHFEENWAEDAIEAQTAQGLLKIIGVEDPSAVEQL